MKKQVILEISKTGTNYTTKVPKGTLGNDVEIGLAVAINDLVKFQQETDPTFKVEAFMEKLKGWIKCLQ